MKQVDAKREILAELDTARYVAEAQSLTAQFYSQKPTCRPPAHTSARGPLGDLGAVRAADSGPKQF
jgi:hypothetical protein